MVVENVITPQEHNGESVRVGDKLRLVVKNHWNVRGWVVLEIGDQKYTVSSRELIAAISNATNTGRGY